MKVAYYITATGEITFTEDYDDDTASSVFVADTPASHSYKVATDPTIDVDTHYVSGGAFDARPVLYGNAAPQILANGGADAEGLVEFALPSGTVVYSSYHNTSTTSGAENFTFKTLRAGEYLFTFDPPFPYQPLTVEISAYVV